jgi:hypothetical protein
LFSGLLHGDWTGEPATLGFAGGDAGGLDTHPDAQGVVNTQEEVAGFQVYSA